MGQAKIRKLQGTYPLQGANPKQTHGCERVNVDDAGRTFAALYRGMLDHLHSRFPDRNGPEEREGQAHASLLRMMELGAQDGFPVHEPLILFVSWQDRTGGWWKLSTPEKWAIARLLHDFEDFPLVSRKAVQAYLERVKIRVEGDSVIFGIGSPWVCA